MKGLCTTKYGRLGWMGPQRGNLADTPYIVAGKLFRFLSSLQCCVNLPKDSTLSYSPACLRVTRIVSYGKWDHQHCNLLTKCWVLITISYTIYTSTLLYPHFPDTHFFAASCTKPLVMIPYSELHTVHPVSKLRLIPAVAKHTGRIFRGDFRASYEDETEVEIRG
jgi:hypothetical protein